jgi:hypothetical protein
MFEGSRRAPLELPIGKTLFEGGRRAPLELCRSCSRGAGELPIRGDDPWVLFELPIGKMRGNP